MPTWTRKEALARFASLDAGARAKVELGAASDVELTFAIIRNFLAKGLADGWSFDEDLAWQQSSPPARTLDAMVAQFRDLLMVKQDRDAAKALRDRFLGFYPEGAQHVPIVEALYDAGKAITEAGEIVDA